MFQYQIDIICALTDSDTADFDDIDIDELKKITDQIKWVNSEPSRRYSKNVGPFTLQPFDRITLGQFIDLEYYFANNYYTNFCNILSIVYKQTNVNIYGNTILEPYDYIASDRAYMFQDFYITDVYGIINEYLKYRESFTNSYTHLLVDQDAHLDDEVLTDPEEIKEQQREKKQQEHIWTYTIMQLCNGDASRFDKILNMPAILIFNILAMQKTFDQ
jgi:hypothetical protein